MTKRIGLLYGMERSFPGILAEHINKTSGGKVVCEPVQIGSVRIDQKPPYDLILDRISHDVPFYRTFMKQCVHQGIHVVNNPFWFAADDKYFGCLVATQCGVANPRTVLLPSKEHPPGCEGSSFSNLKYPFEWEQVWDYLQFPLYLKPSDGGGWKHVYRCAGPDEFFEAYNKTGDICMMAQEEIVFTEYFRCYCLGQERVHLMRYDPKAPHHERYVKGGPPIDAGLARKLERDVLALNKALGYDFNTAEFAVRDGIPYAIDFTNPCPDAEPASVGDENFGWVLTNAAEHLIDRALNPRPFKMTGSWPEQM